MGPRVIRELKPQEGCCRTAFSSARLPRMTVSGSCHCGAVRIAVPARPEWLGSCNCSICTRLGTLMAYYPDEGAVRIEGETRAYIWGDRMIGLHHCPTCGCATHWQSLGERFGRMGVNARLLDGFEMREGVSGAEYWLGDARLEVRFFDNAG